MNDKDKIRTSDIARLAGVSPATVSRVINHRELVKRDTINAVLNAMKQLGIELPNLEAYNQNDKRIILVNCPTGTNPFYEEVLEGAASSTTAHGYDLILNYDILNQGSLDNFISLVKKINVSGIILLSTLDSDLLDKLNSVVPVVQCCEFNKESDLPFVSIDDFEAARGAVRYLTSAGRNKIAFINGPMSYKYAKERLEGFRTAMDEANLSVPSSWILHVPQINYDMAYTLVLQLLRSDPRPNAVFAASDVLAAAVVNAARKSGLKVPDDLMAIGFDNIPLCQMVRPTLTSINQPKFRLGYTACEILIETVQGIHPVPRSTLLPTELIIRESTTGGL